MIAQQLISAHVDGVGFRGEPPTKCFAAELPDTPRINNVRKLSPVRAGAA